MTVNTPSVVDIKSAVDKTLLNKFENIAFYRSVTFNKTHRKQSILFSISLYFPAISQDCPSTWHGSFRDESLRLLGVKEYNKLKLNSIREKRES